MRRFAFVALLYSLTSALPGCASSGSVRAAERGEWPALRASLVAGARRGSLGGGEARSIARAVAARELAAARGDAGLQRVNEARPCADPLEDALERRADARPRDAVGARAAYVLVDAGLARPGRWDATDAHPDGAWRAVAARALRGSGDGARRRQLFLDLDARVRRAALQAALDAEDPADAPALLEVVRLDPDGVVRHTAAAALGRLGGADVVSALRDRWETADEPLRAAIAAAWASEASARAGGRDRLLWATSSHAGAASIAAASALLRFGGRDAGYGAAALARFLDEDTSDNRILAIRLSSPADPDLKQALRRAAESDDRPVRVAALHRLAYDPTERAAALAQLGPIAAGASAEAPDAKSALAELRDRRAVLLLFQDREHKDPDRRARAAVELAAMGEAPWAAASLADADPSVRTRVACALLR
ncbi:MAG TPA: HEAT repeat domain-containing protein [Polyangiaceae bacterium]|nr:HEAT repeat domain-containing protein [Polyangiaceae bacterium]